jgi:hypothetical protein
LPTRGEELGKGQQGAPIVFAQGAEQLRQAGLVAVTAMSQGAMVIHGDHSKGIVPAAQGSARERQ